MTAQEIKNSVKILESQIGSLNGDLTALFKTELLSLMKRDDVKVISMGLNNHEFNDGDATNFSLYYEDLKLEMNDGKVCEPYEDENKELKPLRESFVKFFDSFQSIFENEFSDGYESISFEVKGSKLKVNL